MVGDVGDEGEEQHRDPEHTFLPVTNIELYSQLAYDGSSYIASDLLVEKSKASDWSVEQSKSSDWSVGLISTSDWSN